MIFIVIKVSKFHFILFNSVRSCGHLKNWRGAGDGGGGVEGLSPIFYLNFQRTKIFVY